MRKTGKIEKCFVCSKEFYVPLWWKNHGAKYCSRKCYWKSKIGKFPWNKGLKGKGICKSNGGSFGSSEMKWKGTLKDYKKLHYCINKYLGKPEKCSKCGKIENGKKIHWANKSGEYKKELNDWIRLCSKCHYLLDKADKRRIKYD